MGTHPIFESDFDCLTEMEEQNEVEVLHFLNLSYISRIDESNRLLRSLSNHYALLASKRAEIHKIEQRMCSYCGNNRLGIYNTDVVRIGGKKSKGKKRKILRKYCRSCNDMTEVPLEKIAPLRPPKKKPELLTQSKKKQKTKPSPNQPPGLTSFLTKFKTIAGWNKK